jgi:DNA polymerase-3 subunit epsilon
MSKATYIVVDTETTGLYCWQHDVVQLAAVILDEDLNEIASFNQNLRPLKMENVQQEALDCNGLTREQLMGFQDGDPVWRAFVNWTNGYGRLTVVGHNYVGFDKEFINFAMRRLKLRPNWYYHPADTCVAAKFILNLGRKKTENIKLVTLVEYFGIEVEGELHDALVDVRATAELLRKFKALMDFMWGKLAEEGL